ncbi:Transcription factor, fungi [Penicillium italicum]|uniref:Transcription factor, fungi n=1 Tax=Penicillium italicum TaxID=40296 RepID=A0A0A2L8K7_PENIT|nr:Transcription factor, fungi [Penicillium italicum]
MSRTETRASKERALGDRLKRLEDTIQSFVRGENASQINPPPQSEVAHATHESGSLSNTHGVSVAATGLAASNGSHVGDQHFQEKAVHSTSHAHHGKTSHVNSSHWVSILEDIKEVRESLSTVDPFALSEPTSDGASGQSDVSLATGPEARLNIKDILVSLPTRPICDMLVSRYFNASYMVLGIVHSGKFQEEYEEFWKAPHKAPVLWTALLFAILSVSVHFCLKANADGALNSMIPSPDIFQQKTAQCLLLGRYRTANAYALEALLLYLQSGFLGDMKTGSRQWFDMGIILRLAFRMGYHRDPSTFPGKTTPFESEMRRRVWLHIFQLDALLSFQLGLPSMIPAECCDTHVPRNLHEADLHVGMSALPPSRPSSEYTPFLYSISKAGVMSIFKKIVAHTISLAPPSYSRTITLDAEMRGAYSLLPDFLKRRDTSQSLMDSSEMILNRCNIELLYLKGLVVLHRRHIRYEDQDAKFETSRRYCVEAALEILARQADLHQAFQPGGRLHEDQWMLSSLATPDFLLAAMVICLDLSVRLESHTTAFLDEREDHGFVSKEIVALKTSQCIWAANSHRSPESRIASLALDLMARKVSERQATFSSDEAAFMDIPRVSPELPYMEPMSEMIDGSETLDWLLLDQYFQNSGLEVPQLDSSNDMAGLFADALGAPDPFAYN